MSVFSIDDDVKAFLARAQLTLEKVEAALADAEELLENANGAVTQLRAVLAEVQTKGIRVTPS